MARELVQRGFDHVYALAGGFEAWRRAGLPVEPKEEPAAECAATDWPWDRAGGDRHVSPGL